MLFQIHLSYPHFLVVVCGRVPWLYQYWPVGLCFLWFYVQELPKAQPAVVLVLKRLRRRGNGLKSHPTDWEKPGIEPATPGLQDIGLSPTPRFSFFLWPCSLAVPVLAGWVYAFCGSVSRNSRRLNR